MSRTVSIRELRNSTRTVIEDIEAGEVLTLTVNRRAVADIVPHRAERSPWVPSQKLRRILESSPGDPALLDDLAVVRESLIESE